MYGFRFSRLVDSTRVLYIVMPALALLFLLLISSVTFNTIASDSARRLARQYAVEAAATFLSSTNPHFVLMQQVSRSTTISRWLAYEDDDALKAMAFEEIRGYKVFTPYAYLMFTVYDSMQGYDFELDLLSWQEFLPWGQLAGGEVSQWFFDTRDAEKAFILNIQRTRPVDGRFYMYVWSNHRMYYQGRFVGVVTVGTPFAGVFNNVFGGYDVQHKRGYIIDGNGAVRADSALLLETEIEGLPTMPNIPEIADNPELATLLSQHLQTMQDGVYVHSENRHEAIPMSSGPYRYASIAPIVGTDWSVVVMSNHLDIYSLMRNMPMILAAIAILLASVLLGNIMVRRIILEPLFSLTESVAAADNIIEERELYGLTRQDEIGDLARTVHDMRISLKHAMAEAKRVEIAEESSRAKSKFLARMSHEIRTPLTAVLGISEIQLQNPKLSPTIENAFSKIQNAANLLLNIINDILDLSRIEAGKMILQNDPYETASMISDVAHIHLAYVSEKDIEFKLSVDENLPAFLIGDVMRIEQIINNLLSNAFKYTHSGTVEISLHHENTDEGTMLTMVIKDTGMGMSPEQLSLLSTEYTRFHDKDHKFIEGTGLGMSIVYSIAKMMDATIKLDSKVGVGTEILVRIPQKRAGDQILGKELAQRLEQFDEGLRSNIKRFSFVPEAMPHGSVLVVDDVQVNLYVAHGLLSFYQLDIETCSSGQDAIDKIQKGKAYDIVFMDHMMPGMNGTETMRAMRKLGYNQPIVALTANALIGQAEEFIKNGFDGFISKPIQTKHLNTILTKFIQEKSSARPGIEEYQQNAKLLHELRQEFAASQSDTLAKLEKAIREGDISTAHILAHTLKGVAGLIQERPLSKTAGRVEFLLAGGKIPNKDLLNILENNLSQVLSTIKKESRPKYNKANKNQALATLDHLDPLLSNHNAEAINLINNLRSIPEASILIHQLKEFQFNEALTTSKTLRQIIEENY